MSARPFEIICEIEPPTRPDLMHVRHQIGTLSKVADSFLIPDNHLGRATVSSVAGSIRSGGWRSGWAASQASRSFSSNSSSP